jgi:hypothetical protein
MRTLLVCLAAAVIATSAEAAGGSVDADRDALIATLERMIETGEPHHASHDEGQLLQRAVNLALMQQDAEVELLAMRAAAVITAQIARPVITAHDAVPLSISARVALKLPRPVVFNAAVSASVDGGDTLHLGRISSDEDTFELATALPWNARLPGAHHLRLRVQITFEGEMAPPPEYRDLPELVYATYDPAQQSFADARIFLFSPAGISAQHVDNLLPDMPFGLWLNSVLVARGGEPMNEFNWRIFFCDCARSSTFSLDRQSSARSGSARVEWKWPTHPSNGWPGNQHSRRSASSTQLRPRPTFSRISKTSWILLPINGLAPTRRSSPKTS